MERGDRGLFNTSFGLPEFDDQFANSVFGTVSNPYQLSAAHTALFVRSRLFVACAACVGALRKGRCGAYEVCWLMPLASRVPGLFVCESCLVRR